MQTSARLESSWLGALLLLACSSHHGAPQKAPADAASDATAPTCANLVNRLTACGVLTGTRLAGCTDDAPILPCVMACLEGATCTEVAANYCMGAFNAFAGCLNECQDSLPPPEFVCDDGSRISARWRCDGVPDCPNGEDEKCPPGTFTCADGLSIPAGWRCDGVTDCSGGEDERDCGPRLICSDGVSLPASRECDGVADCADGSDETDCVKRSCQ
jgi:hypothetical protein